MRANSAGALAEIMRSVARGLLAALVPAISASQGWIESGRRAHELQQQGKFADGERLAQAALRQAMDAKASSADVASLLNLVGLIEQDLGKYLEAEKSYLGALREAPRESALHQSARNNLVTLYIEVRRWRKAEQLLMASIEEGNRDSADSLQLSLAAVYHGQAKLPDALKLYQKVLVLRETSYGADHPALVPVLNNLGLCLSRLGRQEEALKHLERSNDILRRQLPIADVAIAKQRINIAHVLCLARRCGDAEPLAREAVAGVAKSLGTQHSTVALALSVHATILKKLGRKSEARALEKRATQILRQSAAGNIERYTVDFTDLMPEGREKRGPPSPRGKEQSEGR